MVDISVVIPVFNEEESLPLLYDRLNKAMKFFGPGSEIIFVDDASVDGSHLILSSIASNDNRVKILRNLVNVGQVEAILIGAGASKNDILVTMDADLQSDPADIPRLVERLNEGFDMVCGWRYPRKDPWHKVWKSKIANHVQRCITGLDLHDLGCALRAYKRDVFKNITLSDRYAVPFMPIVVSKYTDRITEIKVRHYHRSFGKSKYNFWTTSFRTIAGYIKLAGGKR